MNHKPYERSPEFKSLKLKRFDATMLKTLLELHYSHYVIETMVSKHIPGTPVYYLISIFKSGVDAKLYHKVIKDLVLHCFGGELESAGAQYMTEWQEERRFYVSYKKEIGEG